jgi:hypothetical protein
MTTCRSCGSNVTGNFCANCGAPVAFGSLRRCPTCNNEVASNMAYCSYCGSALRVSPYSSQAAYANQPQNNMGKYLMGALGGAAAILGGEMLLHDVERGFRRPCGWGMMGGPWGYGFPHRHHHHHHHHRW